jgi:predicted PhzF superfamily epimerase YddE/YHI9
MSAFGGKADMPLSAAPRSVSSYIFALTIELHSNMQVEFVTIDVFTDRQFGGNPLAVVADGTELSTRQMQAIAAEFNLAETTFVLPPERPENTAKVRIFTPRAELPFAGHPNIGTVFVLGQRGECHGRPIHGNTLQFEEIKVQLHKATGADQDKPFRHVPRCPQRSPTLRAFCCAGALR